MRRRALLVIGLALLIPVAAIGLAQQPPAPPPPMPPPMPPRTLPPSVTGAQPPTGPVMPAGAAAPVPHAAHAETPLAKFEPLAAFPATTQQAVRSVLLGSAWLTRMNQAQGRFVYGYIPALRQSMDGDHDLKQALATMALAQAARFAGDDRQTAVASQAILTLLAATRVEPTDPNCRVPVRTSLTCNRVGFAATLALAIYELPGADEKLLAEAERLCNFLQSRLRTDGSVHYTDEPSDAPMQLEPAGVNEYPGFALHAIAVSNRVKPTPWKGEALKRGLDHYRAFFRAKPHPMLAATLTPAFAEHYLQSKSSETAAAVFEMNDWLIGLQYPPSDPRFALWAGGFRRWANGQPVDAAPGFECGAYLQSLSCAHRLARLAPDQSREREARYKQAAVDAVQFLTGLQYLEANTRHFENTFRANTLIGGFYLSPTDGNLRIDATAWGVCGMLQFLGSGAEK
jgi:hypothetical protein